MPCYRKPDSDSAALPSPEYCKTNQHLACDWLNGRIWVKIQEDVLRTREDQFQPIWRKI